jgi:hypothetical protein
MTGSAVSTRSLIGGIELMVKDITFAGHDVRKNFPASIRREKKCEEIEHALGEAVFFSL